MGHDCRLRYLHFSPYPQIITKLFGDSHYIVDWQSELMPFYRKLQAK
jgi:hypothetical protein